MARDQRHLMNDADYRAAIEERQAVRTTTAASQQQQ
jgi:hypothetical protein